MLRIKQIGCARYSVGFEMQVKPSVDHPAFVKLLQRIGVSSTAQVSNLWTDWGLNGHLEMVVQINGKNLYIKYLSLTDAWVVSDEEGAGVERRQFDVEGDEWLLNPDNCRDECWELN